VIGSSSASELSLGPARRFRAPRAGFGIWLTAALAVTGAATAFHPALGGVAVLVMAAIWAAWADLTLAGYAMVALVPITSGLARGTPIPGFRLSEVLTVALGLAILVGADHRRSTRWSVVDAALALYALATFALGIAALYRAPTPIDAESLGTLTGPLQYLIFLRALGLLLQSSRERVTAAAIAVLSSAVVTCLAIAQAFSGGLNRVLKGLTAGATDSGSVVWASSNAAAERVSSLFPHRQVLAAYLVGVVLIGVALLIFVRFAPALRRSLMVATGLALVALALSQTLAAIAAVFVGSAILAAWSPARARYLAALVLATALLGAGFAGRFSERAAEQSQAAVGTVGASRSPLVPQSVAYRWEVWTEQSLPAIDGHWVLGVGPTLPDTLAWRATESQYITLLFRGGLVLLGVYLLLVASVLWVAWRGARAPDPGLGALSRALLVLMLMLIPMQIIQPYLTYGGVSHMVWLLAALVAPASVSARRAPLRVRARGTPAHAGPPG
jgi:hypothetical protein